jgi:cyanophycinase-like exopeptidase
MPGRITLVGAGELMSAMSRVHREVLSHVRGDPHPVFLDTTAGFEPNVDAIVGKALEYYERFLQLNLRVASFRHRDREPPARVAEAIAAVRSSNLIFAGPGSPTYAVRHWRDTPLWDAVVRQFEVGADILFASAASISLGRWALPVYEIFKVGEDPHWVAGLDLLGRIGLSLAVVPHFDDTSGGDNFDSRYCYIGAERFDVMQSLLPPDVTILGIDAYTAVTFDPSSQTARVSGQSGITLIGDGESRRCESGEVIAFSELASSERRVVTTFDPARTVAGYEFTDSPASGDSDDALGHLVMLVEGLPGIASDQRLDILSRLKSLGEEMSPGASLEGSLLDLLVELRAELRKQKQFALADKTRNALADLGVEIGDTPQGSSWTRRE